jgi:hypothetical protein
MNKLIITSVWLIIGLTLYSQEPAIEYTYDAAGNRETRTVIYLSEKIDDKKTSEIDDQSDMLSFSDKIGEHSISIFPNPTKNDLKIEITGIESSSDSRLEVYSSSGKRIYKDEKLKSKNTVDFSGRPAGTYLLKILIDGKSCTWKIIKE